MSIFDQMFGIGSTYGLYDYIGHELCKDQVSYNDYLQQAHAAQLASLGEYYQQFYNNQKSQETVKQEVKPDPNVIDVEFEIIEVKELEKI